MARLGDTRQVEGGQCVEPPGSAQPRASAPLGMSMCTARLKRRQTAVPGSIFRFTGCFARNDFRKFCGN